MKIAYLTSYYPAVSHTFIRREVHALREQGVDVQTFSIKGPWATDALSGLDLDEVRTTRSILGRRRSTVARDLLRSCAAHPAAVAATAWEAMRSVRGVRRRLWQVFYVAEAAVLQQWMAESGARHVHAHFANAPSDVARWTKALGNRIDGGWTWSFTMHGPTELYAVAEHSLPAKLADADFVACISDFCRSQMMVFSPPDAWDKFEVVHCGVDPREFEQAHPVDDGTLKVICVGRLVPEKGQTVLLRAARRVLDAGVDVRLTFVGDGRARETVETEATKSGVDVAFKGALDQDQLLAALLDADVFCLPSFAEGLPVVLMEAMASCVPVVTTRIAGVQELVEDGVSGFVVPPGRDDLLAGALLELANDPERARAMGEAGRAKVSQEFDVRASAALLEKAFAAVAEKARPASSGE
jgi:glycosyltransferase involved in cell wall biosynthesis